MIPAVSIKDSLLKVLVCASVWFASSVKIVTILVVKESRFTMKLSIEIWFVGRDNHVHVPLIPTGHKHSSVCTLVDEQHKKASIPLCTFCFASTIFCIYPHETQPPSEIFEFCIREDIDWFQQALAWLIAICFQSRLLQRALSVAPRVLCVFVTWTRYGAQKSPPQVRNGWFVEQIMWVTESWHLVTSLKE